MSQMNKKCFFSLYGMDMDIPNSKFTKTEYDRFNKQAKLFAHEKIIELIQQETKEIPQFAKTLSRNKVVEENF